MLPFFFDVAQGHSKNVSPRGACVLMFFVVPIISKFSQHRETNMFIFY